MRSAGFLSCLLLCVSVLHAAAQSEKEAACRAQASVDGVREIVNAVAPELVDTLVGADIGDIAGRTSVTLIGNVDYTLSQLNIQSASYTNLHVDLPEKVHFGIEGITVRVTLDWSFNQVSFPWMYGSGQAVAVVSNSDIQVGISVDKNELGQLTAVIDAVDVTLRDVDITTSGSWFSWLYNFLIKIFDGTVKDALESVIRNEAVEELNILIDEILASIPTTIPINERLVLDYSLTEAPNFVTDPSSIVFASVGEFHDPSDNESPPFPRADFNEHLPIPNMARVWLDQFILNSFLYTAYETGQIKMTVREGEPVDIGFGFNTNDYALIIPSLPELYPNREVELIIEAVNQPMVQITEAHTEVDGDAYITFMVDASGVLENPKFEEAFTILAHMATTLTADLDSAPDHTRLTMELGAAAFKLELLNTNIGEIDVQVLNDFVHAVFDEIVIPMANELLKEGLVLPSLQGLVLQDADIKFHKDFIAIDTDLEYNIPEEILEHVHARIHARRNLQDL